MRTIYNNRPKLLLIAGYFPPVRISTGSIRPWNLARCLINSGWEVTVVTPKISIWDPIHLDDVENKKKQIEKIGIRMIYTSHKFLFLAPWRYSVPKGKVYWFLGGILRVVTRHLGIQSWIGWVPSALDACKKIRPLDVDVILATGAPFCGFEIAHKLAKRLRKPFILDYRDLWTNNPWDPNNKKWVRNQEENLLNECDAITIVSPISAEALSKKYKLTKKVYTITNGYDKNDTQSIEEKSFEHFSIIFTGSLIPPKLTLLPILKVLKYIQENNLTSNIWKFHYFGPSNDLAITDIRECGLESQSIIHGNLPRTEILSYIKGASLNVIVTSSKEDAAIEDKGVIPGKVFELIGLNAKILPIVPQGSAVEAILADVGVRSFYINQQAQISDYILKCMNGYNVELISTDKYSWDSLSRTFDILLRNVIQNHTK